MNSTSQQNQGPSISQLFGNDPATKQYIQYLPKQINFPKPIVPRLDIGRTKRMAMKRVHEYDRQLRLKYPPVPGKKANPEYSSRRLNSGTMATFDAILEMYSGYQNAIKEGAPVRYQFSVSPSGIASRRYKAVRSMNTIGDHLERLEATGIFEMSYNAGKQKYNITWDIQILVALPDQKYREEIAKIIVLKNPKLASDENFKMWKKRLNPSFFAVSSPLSPQFSSMYLLFKQEQDINTLEAESVNWEKQSFPPNPLPKQEQRSIRKFSNSGTRTDSVEERKDFSGAGHQKVNKVEQREPVKVDDFKKTSDNGISFYVENAFAIAIGILDMWWYDKIKSGLITERQITTAKNFIRYWLLQQGLTDTKLSYRAYIVKVFIPVLKTLRGAMLKYNYNWIPYIDKFFDPQWICNDGSPAGYLKSILKFEELREITKKTKLRRGTRNKIKNIKLREEVFSKEFFFLMRNPSQNNYLKSEQRIRSLKDKHLTNVFIKSITSAKLLPVKFMNQRMLVSEN